MTTENPTARSLTCRNCGHDSPHVQQDGDECWCRCVDYVTDLGFPVVSDDVILTHDPIKEAGGYY